MIEERIIFVVAWLISSEIIYIWSIKGDPIGDIKRNWFFEKGLSLGVGAFVSGICLLIYVGIIEHTKIFFIVVGSIVGLVLFFYLNYKLGLSLAKKPKKK